MKQTLRLQLLLVLCTCNLIAFSQTNGNGNSSDRITFWAKLYAGNGNIADGNAVVFDDDFSNDFDAEDAEKMMNPGENFGMRKFGRMLVVEARNHIASEDSVLYDLTHLQPQTYQIKFAPQNMAGSMQVVLKDKYLNTETTLSSVDSSFFFFTVTGVAGSFAHDRFKVTFKKSLSLLPVNFTNINSKPGKKNSVEVQWTCSNEVNLKYYEIERSENGLNFTSVGKNDVAQISNGQKQYQFTDAMAIASDNYYRIKAVNNDGSAQYSTVTKTHLNAGNADVFIQTKAGSGIVDLKFINQPKATYYVAVVDSRGNIIAQTTVALRSCNESSSLALNRFAIPGVYFIQVKNAENSTIASKAIVL